MALLWFRTTEKDTFAVINPRKVARPGTLTNWVARSMTTITLCHEISLIRTSNTLMDSPLSGGLAKQISALFLAVLTKVLTPNNWTAENPQMLKPTTCTGRYRHRIFHRSSFVCLFWGIILTCLTFCSEIWGEDSRCIESTSGEGRCYKTACVKDIMALKINVRGEWLTCTYDFEKIETRVGAGLLAQTVVCPRLSSVCPDLFACPFNWYVREISNSSDCAFILVANRPAYFPLSNVLALDEGHVITQTLSTGQ